VDEEEFKEELFIYLWDNNKPLFDIYQIVRGYIINEFYSLDSAVLLALITDNHLPITKSLKSISYIHSGYVAKILPKVNSNDRPNQESDT